MTRDVRAELAEIVEAYARAWTALRECVVDEGLMYRSQTIITEACVFDIMAAMARDVAAELNAKGESQ